MKLTIMLMIFAFCHASLAFNNVTIAQDLEIEQQSYDDDYSYYDIFSFIEREPGVIGDNVIADGCHLSVGSDVPTLKAGQYKVVHQSESRPSVWDRRWSTFMELDYGNDRLTLRCQTTEGFLFNPITSRYIRQVSGGILKAR